MEERDPTDTQPFPTADLARERESLRRDGPMRASQYEPLRCRVALRKRPWFWALVGTAVLFLVFKFDHGATGVIYARILWLYEVTFASWPVLTLLCGGYLGHLVTASGHRDIQPTEVESSENAARTRLRDD